MIALLDTPNDLDECADEIGHDVGQLLTPLTRRLLRTNIWAIDNGNFSQFNRSGFLSLLERNSFRQKQCLFVVMPDVVGSARRTLEVYEHWSRMEIMRGWKRALACQDGQEQLPIPWGDIAAVFIGGTTNWKCGPAATHIIKAAQLLGKHVHVGRVNTAARWKHFEDLGVDTADGTGIARYSHMRNDIANRDDQHQLSWIPE